MTDYVEAYRNYLENEKHASANTSSSYLRDIHQFRDWLLERGFADLRKVKKDQITAYQTHLSSCGKSPATVTRATASIKLNQRSIQKQI